MPNPPEATRHHDSRKLLILLPLRAIQNNSFHYETPCIRTPNKKIHLTRLEMSHGMDPSYSPKSKSQNPTSNIQNLKSTTKNANADCCAILQEFLSFLRAQLFGDQSSLFQHENLRVICVCVLSIYDIEVPTVRGHEGSTKQNYSHCLNFKIS